MDSAIHLKIKLALLKKAAGEATMHYALVFSTSKVKAADQSALRWLYEFAEYFSFLKPQNNGFFTILVEEPIEYESEYVSTTNFEQVSLIQNLAQNKYSPNLPIFKYTFKSL